MKTNVISIKVDDEMKTAIKDYANKKDIPVSQVIREAIKAYLNNN